MFDWYLNGMNYFQSNDLSNSWSRLSSTNSLNKSQKFWNRLTQFTQKPQDFLNICGHVLYWNNLSNKSLKTKVNLVHDNKFAKPQSFALMIVTRNQQTRQF